MDSEADRRKLAEKYPEWSFRRMPDQVLTAWWARVPADEAGPGQVLVLRGSSWDVLGRRVALFLSVYYAIRGEGRGVLEARYLAEAAAGDLET
jgi:hypothetical protein